MKRKCLTSGMILQTSITSDVIVISIKMPVQQWDEETAIAIDDRLHDGIEYALAPFWQPIDRG